MAELSWEERVELARIRETRMQLSSEEERRSERDRFARSLDHYTHVTRGYDSDGLVRYFNAIRWEPGRLIEGQRLSLLELGPHFKERGFYVVSPQAGTVFLGTMATLRWPWGTFVLGSAVTLAGYETMLHYLRGVVPVHMYGDAAATPASREMLTRLTQGVDGQVTWDEERRLLAYPSGPVVDHSELTGLSPAETARYLSRAPGALGEDPGAVVPVSAEIGFVDAFRWFAHRSGGQLISLLRVWAGRRAS